MGHKARSMNGIVLQRMQYREYDQIITVYTKERGLIRYVAKGIKKMQSKNSAALEPFSCIRFGEAPGKEYAYLTSVQVQSYHAAIRGDLQASIYSAFVCKILPMLLREAEPDNRVYDLLTTFLSQAAQGVSVTLIDWFFLQLMQCLGFLPDSDGIEGYVLSEALFITHAGDIALSNRLKSLMWGEYIPEILSKSEEKQLHQISLSHLRYHTEQPIRDWQVLKLG